MKPKHQRAENRLRLAEMAEIVAGQLRAPFRGEIWEFFQDTPMLRGFANDGDPFDINTANYLRIPMQKIRSAPYGRFFARSALQTLKTGGMIEMPAGYFMTNDPGDMTIYFQGDESALDQAKARTMNYWKGNSAIASLLSTIESRHDLTTDEIFLPGMVLRIWPLNLSSTQKNTLRYVMISDAFLSGRTGMIGQAWGRITQHNTSFLKDYKFIVESQGSDEGDDFDVEFKKTDMAMLHVKCPLCASVQKFDWLKNRRDDFIPTPPLSIPSLDHIAWIEHHRPIMISDERRHCGMQRGDGVKREDNSYDKQAILDRTFYECFHCGCAWMDVPETRRILDESSVYFPSNDQPDPASYGFSWPAWCGQRIQWGGIMIEYLDAKRSAASGNYEPLRLWYQKRAAREWSLKLTMDEEVSGPSVGSYDPNDVMPDEFCRNMSVDCQQDQAVMEATGRSVTGWFWYEAAAVDKNGNQRQLARGFCKSWEAWIAVKNFWKIPNDRVCIDIGHWPDTIMLKAAAELEVVKVDKPLPPFFIREREVTWLLLAGSDKRSWKHPDGKFRPWSPPQVVPITVFDEQGRRKVIRLKKVFWSNVAFKLQLDSILSGAEGMPKMEVLNRDKLDDLTKKMETGNWTYDMQMSSESYTQERGQDKYEPIRKENHYRDIKLQLLVRQAMDGMLGHLSVVEENAER